MSASVLPSSMSSATDARPIASFRHTLGLLLILAMITYAGIRSHGPSAKAAPPPNLIRLYAGLIIAEWALVYYVWRGIRRTSLTLRKLVRPTTHDWRSILRCALVTIVFWFVWEGSARLMHLLLGRSDLANVQALLPHGVVEVCMWIALSVSAGFCEEIIYRGYLQRQFAAWTGNAAAAIAMQAVVFGICHGYQGFNQVVIITVLGALYGILAYWRRTLVPGIAAHAWSDVYGGWLHP